MMTIITIISGHDDRNIRLRANSDTWWPPEIKQPAPLLNLERMIKAP